MKNRLNFTVDEDVVSWMRLNYKDYGEKSKMVNDFLRYLMLKESTDSEKKLEKLYNEISEKKRENNKIIQKIAYLQSEIERIEKIDNKKQEKELEQIEKMSESFKNSGAWEDVIDS